ncbi:hypothetical protein [Streptomyces sp. x-80]|uniref:hypothetical protein n=1 Tax=Streptomyces sp. x-80 TaxID=2789282 RepID=UPI00397ED1E8
MIATTPALLIHPDGQIEEIILDSRRADQLRGISLHVDGARPYSLGRKAVVHAGQNRETVNDIAQQVWVSVTGGSCPPILRGPVVITGPADRAGDFTSLPIPSAEAVRRASRPRAGAFTVPFGVSVAQRRGGRAYQCDAYAISRDKVRGHWAFVVLDGVGDSLESHRFARRVAPRIARMATTYGDPARALAAVRVQARIENHWGTDPIAPSATAVVAVDDYRSPLIRFAWCGDARAYRLTPTGVTVPLTRDRNLAEEGRDRVPGRRDWNFIASCLMQGPIAAGYVERKYARRLLLCTDGAYAPLGERGCGVGDSLGLAADAKSAAIRCVEGAMKAAGLDDAPDNATALVVDFPQS